MKKKSKRTLTPKLRFPEFRDAPGWEESRVIDACESVTQGGTPDTSNPQYWNGSINWITPAEMGKTDSPYIDSSERKITQAGLDNCSSALLPTKSVIISTRAPIGHLAINDCPMAINQGCKGLIPGDRLLYFFLYCSLLSAKSRLNDMGAGNTFKELSSTALKNFTFPLPSWAEQQKIADCLSSLDGLIAAEGRMLEALKAHKKGLMQQLFPQPGQTQPRLRFPEFRDHGGWEVQSFEDLYDFKPNNNYSRDQLNYDEGTVKNIHYGDIHTRFSTHFHVYAEEVPFVNAKVLPNELNSESLCRPGDVIFADASEDLTDVGKCIEIVDVKNERVLSGSHTILARPRSKSIVVGFGGYLFKSYSARAGIEKEAQGTKVVQISPKRLATIKVFFPSDEQEQHRITGCLTALDTRISAQAAKIDALKQHKRGLMQQLFPAPEEQ